MTVRSRYPWQQRDDAASTIRAVETIRACGIEAGQDFFTLSGSQVTALLAAADAERYRKPRSANGSRGRYYYARLQRLARRMPLDLAQRPHQGLLAPCGLLVIEAFC